VSQKISLGVLMNEGDFIGPIQYRINRGTAIKWLYLLENPPWGFDSAQLSFVGTDEQTYGSPEGLLASIALPNPTIAWDGMSHLYDGEQFYLSVELRKRLKVKGTIPDFYSFSEAANSVKLMLSHFSNE
jgi:hypothetical protein